MRFRSVIFSASALALAGMGDALLYPLLPVYATTMNVPLAWIGVLLSVNRFVRLPANQLFAWLFSRYGYRRISLIAVALAALSTMTYSFSTGVIVLLAARVLWGLCYSALRISSIVYALDGSGQGFRLGLSRSVQETGPLAALLLGPVLVSYSGVSAAFFLLGILSLGALVPAYFLSEQQATKKHFSFSFNPFPSSFNLLVFLSALIVEGALVVIIVRLLAPGGLLLPGLTALAAALIAYRRVCAVVISPLAGKFGDRIGIERTFLGGILLTAVSLGLIVAGFEVTGLVLAFTFQSLSSALAPADAAHVAGERLRAVAANATWRDLGSAAGALIGGFLLTVNNEKLYVGLMATMLTAAMCAHLIKKKHNQRQALWK